MARMSGSAGGMGHDVACGSRDVISGQAEILKEKCCVSSGREGAWHHENAQQRRPLLRGQRGHRGPETAGGGGLLGGDDSPGLDGCRQDSIAVEWLHERDVEDGRERIATLPRVTYARRGG